MKSFLVIGLVLGAVSFANAQHTLFAVETTAGTLGGNTAAYGGLQQYDFASTGGSFTPGPGVPASALSDPCGVTISGTGVYVSNRHGNNQGLGSVQQFTWNGTNLTGGSTIATQSSGAFQGFHGANVAPNGDLFVTTVNGGTRRYRDTGSGYVDIGGTASGAVRDAWVSPDGNKLFESTVGGHVVVTDILANAFGSSNNFGVGGANAMHQFAYRGGSLFVTGFNSSTVHQIQLDGSFNPISSSVVANINGAIGLAFSPDGAEMYVSGHTTDSISRLLWNGSSWTSNGSFATGHNMGYLGTVPEPASMMAIAAGLAGLAARRRKARKS